MKYIQLIIQYIMSVLLKTYKVVTMLWRFKQMLIKNLIWLCPCSIRAAEPILMKQIPHAFLLFLTEKYMEVDK